MARVLIVFFMSFFCVFSVVSGAWSAGVDVQGDLAISGQLAAPITRYVPITVGDLIHTISNSSGDSAAGVIFTEGGVLGGVITFPLPADYIPGTPFNLDLYLVPWVSGGTVDFFVRWTGFNINSYSGTGSSFTSTPVTVVTHSNIHKQSFPLGAFVAPLPELVSLVIRRPSYSDTNTGDVTLSGLRSSYQASR